MRRLLAIAVLLAIAFYVCWPALSAYQIYNAIQKSDKATLERKVDWPSVKASLKPSVDAEVNKALDRSAQDGGVGQVLAGPLRKDIVPKLSETALNTLVTPENIIRLAAEGGSLKGVLDSIVKSGIPGMGGGGSGGGAQDGGGFKLPGGLGGLIEKALGKAPQDKPGPPIDRPAETPRATGGKAPVYSIANIKRFAFTGLGSFEIGVAKDTAAKEPDITARMAFTGSDWKLVGLIPRPQ